jgi:hypothetical protein
MVCMDARRASDALKARAEKTDKADARALSSFHLANQRIGFLRFCACADSRGVWHGGKVFGYGER